MTAATSETRIGKTPNGGVKSQAIFLDEEGNPTSKDKAVAVNILEYDKDDAIIQTTYMTRKGKKQKTATEKDALEVKEDKSDEKNVATVSRRVYYRDHKGLMRKKELTDNEMGWEEVELQ